MKKFLAVLLALTLVLSMTPVFAEETGETTEEVTYNSLAEQYDAEVGNFTRIQTSWKVQGGAVSPMSGNSMSTYTSGTGNFAILKVDLPKLGNGQKYGKMIVRFTHGAGTNNNIAFKVEGIDVPNVSSIADTTFYTTIIKNRTAPAYIAYESANPVVTESPANNTYFHYVDITKWAQESYYAGKDYVYLAVGSWNSTTNMYATSLTDGDYTAAKYYPSYWYSIEDVEAPAALENTAEAMQALGNETLIPAANAYKSAGGTTSAVTSTNWVSTYISGNGNMAIVKVDLPEIPIGKTIGNFAFRYGVSKAASNLRVFKMPGIDWNLNGSIADTDWYKSVIVASSSTVYNANDDSIVYTAGANGSADYTLAYANITSYIKECYAAGQTYCYLAYGDWNSTRNTGNPTTHDSSYTAAGVKPRIYYSFTDVGALELTSSAPAAGAITNETTAIFTFNNKLASATATVNGVEADCTVNASQVTVDLGTTGKKTIVVTATDTARNTVTTDAVTVRAGYESIKLTEAVAKTYMVKSTGSTQSKYTSDVNTSAATVLTIPLPTLEDGKKLGEFKLKFLTAETYSPDWYHLFKIPMDSGDIENFIYASNAPEGKVSIYEYFVGAPNVYKANLGSFTSEATDIPYADGKNCNASYADLTTYANECIERGQKNMLVGFRTSSYSKGIIAIGDSSHSKVNRLHYAYWTVEDTDFTAKAPVITNDNGTYSFKANLANFGANDEAITLYIAQYEADGTLISVAAEPVTVPADKTAADYTSANLTIDADAATVRAFIWDEENQKPMLIGDAIVELK